MKRKLFTLLLTSCLLVASCDVSDFLFYNWHANCPNATSFEKTVAVLEEHQEFFDSLKEQKLIYGAWAKECPQGGYIHIEHGAEWQQVEVLKLMDEMDAREDGVRRFFGVLFTIHNV